MQKFFIKRIYEQPSAEDGYRVLIDRLWARGITKEEAQLNEWNKDLAPSNELRKWFHEDSSNRWEAFVQKYNAELKTNSSAVEDFLTRVKDQQKVTLVFAAKDEQHSQAPILRDYLNHIL